MRWGRKQEQQQQKKASPSSFSFSLSNPFSWISKLKQIAAKPKSQPAKPKRGPWPNPAPRSPPAPAPCRARSASFHDAGDAPRRLSVGEDDTLLAHARTSHARAILRSARHNSVGDPDWRPFSSCRADFKLTESHRMLRPWPRELLDSTTPDNERSEDESVVVCRRRPRRRRRRSIRRRRAEGGVSEEAEGIPPPPRLEPIETGGRGPTGFLDRSDRCEGRKSFSGAIRHRSKHKVRVYSPRTAASKAEICRARASAAVERKKAAGVGEGEDLEGFAVVKCSCDPQKDFRDSMVEMIWQRGIGRPEELERLLACYLSLNSDEHHDVIVKVFRQLWFDLNPERFASRRCHRFD